MARSTLDASVFEAATDWVNGLGSAPEPSPKQGPSAPQHEWKEDYVRLCRIEAECGVFAGYRLTPTGVRNLERLGWLIPDDVATVLEPSSVQEASNAAQ